MKRPLLVTTLCIVAAVLLYVANDASRGASVGLEPDGGVAREPRGAGELGAAAMRASVGDEAQRGRAVAEDAASAGVATVPAQDPYFLDLVVTDETSGAALHGAQLEFRGEIVAETDGLGRARVPLDEQAFGSRQVVHNVWVRLAGYGLAVVYVDRHEPGDELAILLRRGATLRGRILGVTVDDGLSVHLAGNTGFFVQPRGELGLAGPSHDWSAPLAADGSFELTDLPPDTWFWARASSSTRDAELLETDPIVLQPGELRTLEWDWSTNATIAGTVVDQRGTLLDRAYVRARPRSHGSLLETLTDESGRFELGPLRSGEYELDCTQGIDDAAMIGHKQSVSVASGERAVVSLVVFPSATVSGRVLDEYGKPVGKERVILARDGAFIASSESEADGSFRFDVVPAGPCELRLQRPSRLRECPPDVLITTAPAEGIELRFREGAIVSGYILDPATDERLRGTATLTSEDGQDVHYDSRDDAKRFSFRGVTPGRHRLVVVAEDSRVGVLRDVVARAGEREDGLLVPVGASGELLVARDARVAPFLRVYAGDTLIPYGEALDIHAMLYRVPAGEVVVEHVDLHRLFDPTDDEVVDSRRVTLPAGERVEVRFD